MKLKDRAAVYWRIHVLLKNSPDFRNMYFPPTSKMEESDSIFKKRFCVNGQVDDDLIIEYFCLASNENQKKYALEALQEINDPNMKFFWFKLFYNNKMPPEFPKMGIQFQDGVMHIEIRTPLTKKEWNDTWWRIARYQLMFLSGANETGLGTEKDEYYAALENLYIKKPSVKKRVHSLKESFGKDKHYETYSAQLWQEIKMEDPWKENPLKQFDEDLLILRLHRTYGTSAKDEYRKIKFIEWLKHKNIMVAKEDSRTLSFVELAATYRPDFMNMPVQKMDKTLRLKNFEQRLQEVKDAYSWAGSTSRKPSLGVTNEGIFIDA
ncbi:MAG: hypothetical protein Q7S29_00155 [Candidatus Peribacter sp.]|nr:hypothetical protein [Candidatus Peribacter sp.]